MQINSKSQKANLYSAIAGLILLCFGPLWVTAQDGKKSLGKDTSDLLPVNESFNYKSAEISAFASAEAFRFWILDGKIIGRGAGAEFGSSSGWTTIFKGEMINDTLMEVIVEYTETGHSPAFAASESWVLNAKQGTIYVRKSVPQHPGPDRYILIGPEEFLEYVEEYCRLKVDE